MTTPNLTPMDDEESRLLARLAEIRAEKEKLAESLRQYQLDWDSAIKENLYWDDMHKPFSLSVYQANGMNIYVKFNDIVKSKLKDSLDAIRPFALITDSYLSVHARNWNRFTEHFGAEVPIEFVNEILETRVKRLISGPHYEIDVSATKKNLEVRLSPEADSNVVRMIDGFRLVSTDDGNFGPKYTIPINAGFVLFSKLKERIEVNSWPTSWVDWKPEANELVQKDLEKRALIDSIALLDSVDYDPHFPMINPDTNSPYQLKPFQTVGAKFLDIVERGILGYQPGLGKSPMWIAVMYKAIMEWKKNPVGPKPYGLVICPASLRANWARQIYKFTGMYATILRGESPATHLIEEICMTKTHDWVIISYDSIGVHIPHEEEVKDEKTGKAYTKVTNVFPWTIFLNMAKFTHMCFDEFHYMKNPSTGRAKGAKLMLSKNVAFLSGTPIINKPREGFTSLQIINPEIFANYDGFVYQWEYRDGSCKNPAAFKEMMKPYMLRKLRSEVQKDLAPINRIDEICELSDSARDRYDTVLQGIYVEIDKLSGQPLHERNVTSILAQITRLKQVCSDDKIARAAEAALDYYDETGEKVIIFSQFLGTIHAIAKLLGGECVVMTGENPDERMELVDRFQSDSSIHFAVCSSMAMREGIDLDRAMACIFVDPLWAPAYHEQCEGRAYGRLSNAHTINSYYLNAKDTIEEWIANLRARKFAMVSETVDSLNESRNASMALDIIKMLKEEMAKRAWRKK